jgi:hypothetical protein
LGEPPSDPDARDLTAQLGLEAAAGIPRAAGYSAFDVARLRLHVRLERAGDGRCQLHPGNFVAWPSARPSLSALVQCRLLGLVADLDQMARGIVGHAGADQDRLAELRLASIVSGTTCVAPHAITRVACKTSRARA